MPITDIDQVHERLMKNDPDYRIGYEFVKIRNRRFYEIEHDAPGLKKMAEILAGLWNPDNLHPHTFSLGAAAALLELAAAKERAA